MLMKTLVPASNIFIEKLAAFGAFLHLGNSFARAPAIITRGVMRGRRNEIKPPAARKSRRLLSLWQFFGVVTEANEFHNKTKMNFTTRLICKGRQLEIHPFATAPPPPRTLMRKMANINLSLGRDNRLSLLTCAPSERFSALPQNTTVRICVSAGEIGFARANTGGARFCSRRRELQLTTRYAPGILKSIRDWSLRWRNC